MRRTLSVLIIVSLVGAGIPIAHAQPPDPWVVHFGAGLVEPKSHNGTLAGMPAGIDSDTQPTASLEYFFAPNWSVDLLASLPFKHDVRLGGVQAARTKYLPPTLGINYHPLAGHAVSPFVGAGVNYTRFFDTRGVGPLAGTDIRIANTWNPTLHAGVDIALSPRWLLTADVRWLHLEPTVRVNGAKVGQAKPDPLVYGVSFGYRF